MKVITEYECEICNHRYGIEKNAIYCESKGVFDGTLFPIGLMFEYHDNGFVGIFSIAQITLSSSGYGKNHLGTGNYWACRIEQNAHGDSIGDERCGGDYFQSNTEWVDNWIRYHKITPEKIDSPEFKRMVKFLKSQHITPRYYNEQKEIITVK